MDLQEQYGVKVETGSSFLRTRSNAEKRTQFILETKNDAVTWERQYQNASLRITEVEMVIGLNFFRTGFHGKLL
jgi:hypothetical protein